MAIWEPCRRERDAASKPQRGQTYSLTNLVYEHFVRYAHGLQIESTASKKWTLLGVIAYMVFLTEDLVLHPGCAGLR
jgi:hypothetical protein